MSMPVEDIIKLVDTALKAGSSALEIVEFLCQASGGAPLPTLAEFKAETDKLRAMEPLQTK